MRGYHKSTGASSNWWVLSLLFSSNFREQFFGETFLTVNVTVLLVVVGEFVFGEGVHAGLNVTYLTTATTTTTDANYVFLVKRKQNKPLIVKADDRDHIRSII